MPDTYTQLYVQLVFAVQNRACLIPKTHKEQLHKYITGIVQKKKNKLINVNCMPDHAHIFVGLNPSIAISDLVKSIKIASGEFIRDNRWIKGHFLWQEGYGAFSYSRSDIARIYEYISNQELHHQKKSFKDEYIELLNEFDIAFKEEYLFEWIDDI